MRSFGWSFSLGRANTTGSSVWTRDQYARTIDDSCVHVARKKFQIRFIYIVWSNLLLSVYHVDLRIHYVAEVEVVPIDLGYCNLAFMFRSLFGLL